MKFKRRVKLEYGFGQLIVVPMIDGIVLLLLFAVLSSSLTPQAGVNVKLPKAITSDILQEENLIITITGEDIIYLNSTVITVKELKQKLSQYQKKERPLLIKADKRSTVGRVVDIWDLCRSVGIEKINIATNQGN